MYHRNLAIMKMFFIFSYVLLCAVVEIFGNDSKEDIFGTLEEYCNSETFRPQCSHNEVIVIERAIFGRRILGRCLENERKEIKDLNISDQKAVGCFADVKRVIDPLCSLKRTCGVRIAEMKAEVPCYSFLRYFLEVQFSCVRVVQENRECSVDLKVDKQHIFGSGFAKSSCGKNNNPWKIRALPGQKINISLIQLPGFGDGNDSLKLSFEKKERGRENVRCSKGYIRDTLNKKDAFLCFGRHFDAMQIEGSEFISESNNLEIVLNDDNPNEAFLLAIEATGCSDLIPPADAWLKRTENEATIGCYSTRLRWQLKCLGQRWIGVIGNCSQGVGIILNTKNVVEKKEVSMDNQGVLIFGIIIMGVVICMFIGCLGIVLMKRYYAKSKLKAVTRLASTDQRSAMFQNTFNGTSIKYNGGAPSGNISKETSHDVSYYQDDGSNSLLKNSAQYFELDQNLRNATQNNVV